MFYLETSFYLLVLRRSIIFQNQYLNFLDRNTLRCTQNIQQFKINPNGTSYVSSYGLSILNPGSSPYSSPCQASNGKLYGLTSSGGATGNGILFSYDPSANVYTKLLDFNGANGASPYGSLIQAA